MRNITLYRVSRTINYLRGGNPNWTVCEQEWDSKIKGSKFSIVTVFILDALFYIWINEKQHCRRDWLKRRMR